MAEGIFITLTHQAKALPSPPYVAGSTRTSSLLISDISTQGEPRGTTQDPVYVTVGTPVSIPFTSRVAKSFETGSIRGFIDSGDITVSFSLGDEAKSGVLAENIQVATGTPQTTIEDDATLVLSNPAADAAIELLLPAGANVATRRITIKDYKGNAATRNITITPNGSETIDGNADLTISTDQGAVILHYYPADSDWIIV